MCGRATLAILVSSTSIKVATVTVPAMIQGLIACPSVTVMLADAIGVLPTQGLTGTRPRRARGCPRVPSPGGRPGRASGSDRATVGDGLAWAEAAVFQTARMRLP